MAVYSPNFLDLTLDADIQQNALWLGVSLSGQHSPLLSAATSQAVIAVSNAGHLHGLRDASNNILTYPSTSSSQDTFFDPDYPIPDYPITTSLLMHENHRPSTVDPSSIVNPGTLVLGDLPESALYTETTTPGTRTGYAFCGKNDGKNSSNESSQDLRCNWPGCDYVKPFSCGYTRRRHVESVHLNPTRFKCPDPQCNKAFGRKDKRNEHYQVHSKKQGARVA